ncbi:Uncharacterised protein [Yersinia frederiksenii]|nr:Uncharacterised protein [Yersinia frederiksenii]
MNRVSMMETEGRKVTVKFFEFSRAHAKDNNIIICIFEGEDEKYFSPRLTSLLGNHTWHGINTGGKPAVVELYNIISTHNFYKNVNYLCFIDRDFEDWFNNPNSELIYITPGYSIENFYVTETCFRRILSAEFGVSEFNENSSDYNQCMMKYNNLMSEFISCISTFNYWVKSHRIMKRDDNTIPKLNVRNIKTLDLISINLDSVSINYNVSSINSVFKDATDISIPPNIYEEAKNTLPLDKGHILFRGKQNLDFIRNFLMKLKEDRVSSSPTLFSSKGNVRLALSKENAISELSQYADTPECLQVFMKSFLEKKKIDIQR